jgi:hypothetical protein
LDDIWDLKSGPCQIFLVDSNPSGIIFIKVELKAQNFTRRSLQIRGNMIAEELHSVWIHGMDCGTRGNASLPFTKACLFACSKVVPIHCFNSDENQNGHAKKQCNCFGATHFPTMPKLDQTA